MKSSESSGLLGSAEEIERGNLPVPPKPPPHGSSGRRMKTSELDYELPSELIAQRPLERRDDSRLLVYDRASGRIEHARFRDLPGFLPVGSLAVVNDTPVIAARLRLRRPGGGEAEVLLLERLDGDVWDALARPTRRLRPGMQLGPVELLEHRGQGRWTVRLEGEPAGEAPLPPYITEPLAELDVERVTLHVGLDTFRPVTADSLEEHELHSERYEVENVAWDRIAAA